MNRSKRIIVVLLFFVAFYTVFFMLKGFGMDFFGDLFFSPIGMLVILALAFLESELIVL